MNEQEFRILNALATSLGNSLSIRQLAAHAKADYKGVYETIHGLEKRHILILDKAGNASIPRLDFGNSATVDLLAAMELRRKQDFLKGRQEMGMLIMNLENSLSRPDIQSISLFDPERNSRLNRAELLVQVKAGANRSAAEASKIFSILQPVHSIRITPLLIDDAALRDALKSPEANPLRDSLSDKITILNPQGFWISIRKAAQEGTRIMAPTEKTDPATMPEEDMIFNLSRLGYTELGPRLQQGRLIGIEYIITSLFLGKGARRVQAIPILLAKHLRKTNYSVLLFLAQKYGFEARLLGILKALKPLLPHQTLDEPIALLNSLHIKEIKADAKEMQEKLKVYHA